MHALTKLLRSKRGATAIEYGLIASLISIAAIAAMSNLGTRMSSMYSNVSNHLD